MAGGALVQGATPSRLVPPCFLPQQSTGIIMLPMLRISRGTSHGWHIAIGKNGRATAPSNALTVRPRGCTPTTTTWRQPTCLRPDNKSPPDAQLASTGPVSNVPFCRMCAPRTCYARGGSEGSVVGDCVVGTLHPHEAVLRLSPRLRGSAANLVGVQLQRELPVRGLDLLGRVPARRSRGEAQLLPPCTTRRQGAARGIARCIQSTAWTRGPRIRLETLGQVPPSAAGRNTRSCLPHLGLEIWGDGGRWGEIRSGLPHLS